MSTPARTRRRVRHALWQRYNRRAMRSYLQVDGRRAWAVNGMSTSAPTPDAARWEWEFLNT